MDFTLNFCEYNRSNSDYDRIFRPEGSGDFLFLLFKILWINIIIRKSNLRFKFIKSYWKRKVLINFIG